MGDEERHFRYLSLVARSQHGFALIEVLAALLLLAVTIVALLGSTVALVTLSGVHRNVVRSGVEVVDIAERVQRAPYTDCPTLAAIRSSLGFPQTTDGFVLDVASVQYLVSSTSTSPTWDADRAQCQTRTDQGLQRVVVTVARPSGKGTEQLAMVKRDDRCSVYSAQFTATTMAAQTC